jgi:hypothetical protein
VPLPSTKNTTARISKALPDYVNWVEKVRYKKREVFFYFSICHQRKNIVDFSIRRTFQQRGIF